MRVCTDCHFSLQTVTVASSSALGLSGTGTGAAGGDARNGGGGGGVDDERTVNADSGGGGGGGGGDPENLLLRGAEGDVDLDVGDSGSGLGFVERLEAVYLTDEIAGDVVLENVLEWNRIQVGGWVGGHAF